jgi:hypothetical protein
LGDKEFILGNRKGVAYCPVNQLGIFSEAHDMSGVE